MAHDSPALSPARNASSWLRGVGRVSASLAVITTFAFLAPAAADAATYPPGPAGSGNLSQWRANPHTVVADCAIGPVGRRVLVVGDSITSRTKDVLTSTLTAAGWSVCIDSQPGQPTWYALDNFKTDGSFPAYVDVIVMATGSNDIFDPTRLAAQVQRARTYAGTRPMLWVNVFVHRSGANASYRSHDLLNSAKVNRLLVNRYGWRFVTATVDWSGVLTRRPARQATHLVDGVHTTVTGGAVRSALIAQSLAPYLPEPTDEGDPLQR